MYSEVVKPTTESIVSRDYGCDDLIVDFANEEEVTLDRKFSLDNRARFVPRRIFRENLVPE
jgi:hypothetical protein